VWYDSSAEPFDACVDMFTLGATCSHAFSNG
jgi:hypothetical protein